MRRGPTCLTAFLAFPLAVLCGLAATHAQELAANVAATSQAETQRALLNRYCITCHNDQRLTAGLDLGAADLTWLGQGDCHELGQSICRYDRGYH